MDQSKMIKYTKDGYQAMVDELAYLKGVKLEEVKISIAEARSFGDLSENSEYDEAKNEQAKLYGRIAEVEDILAHAVIIEESDEVSDHVGLGCKVKVKDLEFDEEEVYEIVGSQEADPMNGRISDDSPFGRAIIGKAAGDEFTVEAPVGTLKYQIISIEK